jgi:toxin ParE1/3/4
MPKNRIVRLRPKAVSDLENIYIYSCQEFGDVRAEQYIKDIDALFYKLADNPNIGRDYTHIRPDLFAFRID